MTSSVNPVMGPNVGPAIGPAGGPSGEAPRGGPSGEPGWQGYGDTYRRGHLYRSTTNRVWAGVCGGLAEHFGWDASATRIGYAALAVFTGIFPMLMLYIVMAIVVPNGPMPGYAGTESRPYAARSYGPGAGAMVLGVLLVIGGTIALAQRYLAIDWNWAGPAVAIGFGIFLVLIALTRRPV